MSPSPTLPTSPALRRTLAAGCAWMMLLSGNDDPSALEQVERRGELTMLTRNGASSYFLGPEGPTGPEYELVRGFAEFLGVELGVEVADSYGELGERLEQGAGDLIAANLTRTASRERRFHFGPDYTEQETLVVYRRGEKRPRRPRDLVGRDIAVIAGSSYEETLEALKQELPQLRWQAWDRTGIEELFQAIADGNIDITLADAHVFAVNEHFYPAVRRGFSLPGALPQAWAFRPGDDDSLVQKARLYLTLARETGVLAAIEERFFGDPRAGDTVGMYTFLRQVRDRLPELRPVFQEVADAHGLDWRLLAAIGYQESHWDPEATSPTGVRGVMMLTQRTASALGVTDRLDPRQSIEGGARYFKRMRSRVPDRIPEPDRSWMALAAYNMGMGHLEDARVLTERLGGDPDRWDDVEQHLGKLGQERYFKDLRYGYARGLEARRYVRNVRSYYDKIKWMDTHAHPLLVADAFAPVGPATGDVDAGVEP